MWGNLSKAKACSKNNSSLERVDSEVTAHKEGPGNGLLPMYDIDVTCERVFDRFTLDD